MLVLLFFCAAAVRGDEAIDRATRGRIAEVVERSLAVMYVEEDVAAKLAAETKRRILSDAYEGLTPQRFAEKLTADLQEQSGDGHLFVRVQKDELSSPVPTLAEADATIESLRQMMRAPRPAPGSAAPAGGAGPRRIGAGASVLTSAETYRKMNHGFLEARVLEGNVGLVRIDRFAPPTEPALAAAEAAMTMVANTDALIIDLRNAPGGFEAMATHVLSYFFAEARKPLLSAHFRFAGTSVDSFTSENVPAARRRPDVPLYVLTSHEVTFSSAELVAYTLQKFGRAKVVGERTKGGGYAGQVVPIGRGMQLSISVGKPVHPVTKGGWQKVGVVPDVEAPRGEALEVALGLARGAGRAGAGG